MYVGIILQPSFFSQIHTSAYQNIDEGYCIELITHTIFHDEIILNVNNLLSVDKKKYQSC